MFHKSFISFLLVVLLFMVPQSQFAQKRKKDKNKKGQPEQIDKGKQIKAGMLFVDASTQKMLGDLEKAMLLFDEVLKLDPNNHAARYEKAGIYLEQREFVEAIEAAHAAIAGDPKNYWYHRQLESVFTEQGNYDKAIEVAETIVDRFPPAYDDHARLADIAERSQRFDMAAKHYKLAAKRPSGDMDAMVNAARIEREQGKTEAALRTTKEIIAMAPSDPRGYEMHMQLLEKLGREDEAKNMVNQWVEADPANGQAKMLLAGFSDGEKALDLLSEAFLDEKTDLEPKLKALDKAISAYGKDNISDVIALTNMLEKAHGSQAEIDARAGALYLQAGRYSDAATVLRKGLKDNPANEPAWEALIYADYADADFSSMRSDVEESLELYPNSKNLLAWYALWGLATGDPETAEYALNKILKTGAGNSEAQMAAFARWPQSDKKTLPDDVAAFVSEVKQAYNEVATAPAEKFNAGEVVKRFQNIDEKNRLMMMDADFITYFGHAIKKSGLEQKASDFWERAKIFGAKSPENAL